MSLDYMSYPDPDYSVQDAIREACKAMIEHSAKLEDLGCESEAFNLASEAERMMKQYKIKEM